MKVNLEFIKQRLFDCARNKIIADYDLEAVPDNPAVLAKLVLKELDQKPLDEPIYHEHDNSAVFRAAVRAIGSNSRKWSTFRKNEPKISGALNGYSIEAVLKERPNRIEIAQYLTGRGGPADARAIFTWLEMLRADKDYYGKVVRNIATELQERARRYGPPLEPHELFLCVAAYLANPPAKDRERKWPGMGIPLGCEFLRNLGWNGFKPDRHIKRLLNHWPLGNINVETQLRRLMNVIGRADKALANDLKYALIGVEITPEDHSSNLSQVDNLIWLLGAYVEKKGKESKENYLLH